MFPIVYNVLFKRVVFLDKQTNKKQKQTNNKQTNKQANKQTEDDVKEKKRMHA